MQSSSDSQPVRRSSIGFAPPWSHRNRSNQIDGLGQKSPSPFRRPSTPKAAASPTPTCTDSSQSSSASYFSLKPHRRTSAPVPRPRTQPYEAPYFATPPISSDPAASDFRRSPQILHETIINSSRKQAAARQAIETKEGDRGRPSRTSAQTAQRNARPSLHRRRSASESWITDAKHQVNLRL